MATAQEGLTWLINRLGDPDAAEEEELLGVLYEELHALAAQHTEHRSGNDSPCPTVLVHEAWIRLSQPWRLRVDGRSQFFALASRVMRSVLVDRARERAALKRGGGRHRVALREEASVAPGPDVDLLGLDEALTRMEEIDPDLARLVHLRFFGGLEHAEIARTLGCSLRSVERNWRLARAWLHAELER